MPSLGLPVAGPQRGHGDALTPGRCAGVDRLIGVLTLAATAVSVAHRHGDEGLICRRGIGISGCGAPASW